MTPEDLDRFRAGDERLFRELIAQHSPRLLGAALGLTGDPIAAHELVHDCWVVAYRRRHTFSARGSVLGWLLSIVRAQHLEQVRSSARYAARITRYAALEDSVADPATDGAKAIDVPRVRGTLMAALDTLSERQRDVLVLRVLEDQTVAQTAARLCIAEGTVKATLSQALHRLRSILKENE